MCDLTEIITDKWKAEKTKHLEFHQHVQWKKEKKQKKKSFLGAFSFICVTQSYNTHQIRMQTYKKLPNKHDT